MNNNSFRPRHAKREPNLTAHDTAPLQAAAPQKLPGDKQTETPPKSVGQSPSDRPIPDQPTGVFDAKEIRREEAEWSHLEIRQRQIPKKQEALDFIPADKTRPIQPRVRPVPSSQTPSVRTGSASPQAAQPSSASKPTPARPTAQVPHPTAQVPHPTASVPHPTSSAPKAVSPVPFPTAPAPKPASPAPKPMELMGVDFEYTYVDAEKETAADDTDAFDTDAFSTEEQEFSGSTAKNVILGITKALIYIVFVLSVSVVGALTVIRCGNDVFAFVKPTDEVTLSIGEYATVDELAELLGTNEVIDYPFVFRLFAKLKKDDGKFVAGTYTVSPSMNYDELLSAFKKKLAKKEEIRLTIPEGYTVDDIIDLFLENGMGTREGFVEAINEYEYEYWFVKELTEISPNRKYRLEGYLYPDTYDFYKDWEETVIISRFLANFDKKFSKEYRESCAEQGYTVDDVVNLASIIQMEAKYSDEYAVVSSVLHNRLNNVTVFNRRLDCDATIQYTFDERKPVMEEGDTAIDTPYNTYLYGGLPPGPISNPVMSAVDAALFPDDTNYCYFIAQRNGRLRFAKTLNEHNANVADIKAGN